MRYTYILVLKRNDGVRAGEFIVFEVQESLEEVLLHPRTPVSELKDGSLLVKAQCGSDSRALSKLCSVANRPVASSPHNRLNSCQGTIFCRKLLGMSPEYLVKKLSPQHVAKVYRFRSKVNGTLVDSPRLLLTFDVPQLPSELYAGYVPLEVRQFVPRPRRCFKCQVYGHQAKNCRSSHSVCANCGQKGHSTSKSTPCTNTPHCLHCSGDHGSDSFDCPAYSFEKEVIAAATTVKISMRAARKRVQSRYVREGISYAQILKMKRPYSRRVATMPTTPPPVLLW